MKYRKLCSLIFLSPIFLSAVVLTGVVPTGSAAAQQPTRIKRPVKNPPQFPNIIDLENKDAQPASQQANQQSGQQNKSQNASGDQTSDSLAAAIQSLANELRILGQELRSLNIRGQAQIEMLRITRVDMRIDNYERELRPVRERIAALENDERTLQLAMTREALLAQTATAATVNRDELMRQLRAQHEARYRAVLAEKERAQKLEADLTTSLKIYRNISRETEQRIQEAEDALKSIESSPQGVKTERKQ
jgi:hypothetical protein